jgi:hypothetical protein
MHDQTVARHFVVFTATNLTLVLTPSAVDLTQLYNQLPQEGFFCLELFDRIRLVPVELFVSRQHVSRLQDSRSRWYGPMMTIDGL